jgi:DNA polymerase-1
LENALHAGRFPAQAEKLRLFRRIATMNAKAPLARISNQKPKWRNAAALAREWQLIQLAERLEELASKQPVSKPTNR